MEHKLEDLLFTLEICQKNLPGDAHPVHFERLWYIERSLKARDKKEKRHAAANGVTIAGGNIEPR